MKFNPCVKECTYEGSHCQGCGRSRKEIAETKLLVKSIVDFVEKQEYENVEDFANFVSKKVLKKLQIES